MRAEDHLTDAAARARPGAAQRARGAPPGAAHRGERLGARAAARDARGVARAPRQRPRRRARDPRPPADRALPAEPAARPFGDELDDPDARFELMVVTRAGRCASGPVVTSASCGASRGSRARRGSGEQHEQGERQVGAARLSAGSAAERARGGGRGRGRPGRLTRVVAAPLSCSAASGPEHHHEQHAQQREPAPAHRVRGRAATGSAGAGRCGRLPGEPLGVPAVAGWQRLPARGHERGRRAAPRRQSSRGPPRVHSAATRAEGTAPGSPCPGRGR